MKTSQWIKDVKTVIGCEPPQLFKVLAKIAEKEEDSDRGSFARKSQSKILECMEDVKLFLGEIRRNAQDFTLHDITHCINVIDFMGQMLVDVDKLNPAEISFFIYAALLHDIGMVKLPDEDISLNELREDHGDRSAQFIKDRVLTNSDGTQFCFAECDYIYMEYIPSICASHMQEFSFVEKLPESIFIDDMEIDISLCAILLRLADAMDLKKNRAPYQLYQFIVNRSISEEHWKKHIAISSCRIDERGIYRVDGICHDELAHRCLYNHLDMIESEIEKVFKWKIGIHPRLRLSSHIVERNIKTDNYTMWHHSFSMDIMKITNLFMGEQLYGNKKLGLREIIQNSIDACMVRDEMNKKSGNKQDHDYEPKIYIIFDRKNNQVIIRDNGTGMNDYVIQNYFLNIGASYYSSNDFKKENLEYSPSGYFGIGFLACFMLSDDVYVRTAHWKEEKEYEFHFIKSDKFVTKTEKPKTTFSGTEIRLNLDQFEEVFKNKYINETIEDKDLSFKKSIKSFLVYTFCDLKINQKDKDVILCSIQPCSFINYAKENNKKNYDYEIDLSKYFIDIEGIIYLNRSQLYDKMKTLFNIYLFNPLDSIKNGEINISNDIKESLPFINKFYTYSSGEFREIGKNEYIKANVVYFFPTKEYGYMNKNIFEEVDDRTLTDNDIKHYFRFYSWNCLCWYDHFNNNNVEVMFNLDKGVDIIDKTLMDNKMDIAKLSYYIGYYPSFFIQARGVNYVKLSNAVSYKSFKYQDELNYKWWFKQARIEITYFDNLIQLYTFFEIKKIIMKICNKLIKPDSARNTIIESSAYLLKNAISICIFLWIYEQIKDDKKAIVSTQYLKQLILKEWDESVEGLLKPEKKPV